MSVFIKDNRALRSFRLWYKTKNLLYFFKNLETFGLFFFCDTVQPKERILWREEFNKLDVQLIYISKNLYRFIFVLRRWEYVKNLMQGGLVWVKSSLNKEIPQENLQNILKNKNFFFRFLFWKHSFYRFEHLKKTFVLKKREQQIFSFLSIAFSLPYFQKKRKIVTLSLSS